MSRGARKTARATPRVKSSKRKTKQTKRGVSVAKPAFLIVGIGASAGGLEAFKTFLKHMPHETGMAFVLVQHLDPNRGSMLVELLGAHSRMPVVTATHDVRVQPNSVYVIPPNADLTIANSVLKLAK